MNDLLMLWIPVVIIGVLFSFAFNLTVFQSFMVIFIFSYISAVWQRGK